MKPSRDTPDDLLGVAETLESNRPQLSGLEADRIKRRAMAQGTTTATRTSTKGLFMRSRLAITSLLALGLLMTGSGAALGFSALSTTNNASQAQYGAGGGVLDESDESDEGGEGLGDGGVAGDQGEALGDGGVAGDQGEALGDGEVADVAIAGGESPQAVARQAAARQAVAQESRQLASGQGVGGGLPFTGLAAIPVLLIGAVLLAAGLLLRRDMGQSAAQS